MRLELFDEPPERDEPLRDDELLLRDEPLLRDDRADELDELLRDRDDSDEDDRLLLELDRDRDDGGVLDDRVRLLLLLLRDEREELGGVDDWRRVDEDELRDEPDRLEIGGLLRVDDELVRDEEEPGFERDRDDSDEDDRLLLELDRDRDDDGGGLDDRVDGVLEERVRFVEPRRLLVDELRLDKGAVPEFELRLVEFVRLLIRDDEIFARLLDDGVFTVDFDPDDRVLFELEPLVVELVLRVPI